MRSPLGPALSGIFMAELETSVIPPLGRSLLKWKRYVDNALCYKKSGTVNDILNKLNNFHQNRQSTCELEKTNKLAFLDVLLICNKDKIKTAAYRKPTKSDIYLNWNSFSPCSLKDVILKTIIRRPYLICSKPYYLQEELDNIAFDFKSLIIKQLLEEVK